MRESIQLGELIVEVTRKAVKNVHLSVYPPDGHVTLVTPMNTRWDVARAYVISKLNWIHSQQKVFQEQARETSRQFTERESHYLWGRRYLLCVVEKDTKPRVKLDHRRITLIVRPGSPLEKRREVMYEWLRTLLRENIPPLIQKWQPTLGVTVKAYYLQRMKTKWGSCNPRTSSIRLNTELAKKPKDLLEYVVVHEMLHLVEPNHGPRFALLLDQYLPGWRECRAELNELPLAATFWKNS